MEVYRIRGFLFLQFIPAVLMLVLLTAVACLVQSGLFTLIAIAMGLASSIMWISRALGLIHTIVIRPDDIVEFRSHRRTVRLEMRQIVSVYHCPRWQPFNRIPYHQRLFLPGYTYVIHDNGNLMLGQIRAFANYQGLLAALMRRNEAMTVLGKPSGP
ncbi:MAG: hypothetical protein ACYDCO_27695 [Armatimonadota bacterium]